MSLDLKYLKKRAELIQDFYDDKVQTALLKIAPKPIAMPEIAPAVVAGFDCAVPDKSLRYWIDLVPESDRGYYRFIYQDAKNEKTKNDSILDSRLSFLELRYLQAAMTKPAWNSFCSLVSKDASDSDLFLMRYVIWQYRVLKRPVGIDFCNFEMNQIISQLPMDIAHIKIKAVSPPDLASFYKMVYFAKWGLDVN